MPAPRYLVLRLFAACQAVRPSTLPGRQGRRGASQCPAIFATSTTATLSASLEEATNALCALLNLPFVPTWRPFVGNTRRSSSAPRRCPSGLLP